MANALTTAGITLNWAVEQTKGTRPTTGYKMIPQCTALPDQNQAPNTHQSTPLEETEFHRYVPALRDPGGAISITANLNNEFMAAWEELVEAYDTAKLTDLAVWMCVYIPGLNKSWYYEAIPSPLAFGGAEVDGVLQLSSYLTPSGKNVWATPPTDMTI